MPRSVKDPVHMIRVAKNLRYAGVPPVRTLGLPYVRLVREVSTFNQQISAKSAGTRNKKPILNDITFIFCNLKALARIIFRKT